MPATSSALAPPPLQALGDDWYAWSEGVPPGSEVRVHAALQPDGRWHLDGLELEGEVTATLLRALPLGRIEAAVNAFAGDGDPAFERARARVPDELRDHAVPGYPDEFYEVIARAYRMLASQSRRPIAELAAANEVPPTTAQRWVKESRRRGLLPPGRKGKAG